MSIYDRMDWAFTAKVPSAVNASGKVRVGPDKMARLLLLAVRHADRDGHVYLSGRRIFEVLGIGTGDGPLAMRALAAAGLLVDTGDEVNQTTVWRVQFPPEVDAQGARSAPRTADPEGVRSPPHTGARSGARWGVRTGARSGARSGARTGPRTKGKGKREEEGEGAALPRDHPPADVIPINPDAPLTPFCDRHPTGTDDPCHACKARRQEYERRVTAAAAVTCRWDGCPKPRDPDSKNRYCTRHEQRHQEG